MKGSFTFVRDFGDVCYHSYFSIMDELREKGTPDGKYHEIRFAFVSCSSKPFFSIDLLSSQTAIPVEFQLAESPFGRAYFEKCLCW